jgi:flagellar protein FlbD
VQLESIAGRLYPAGQAALWIGAGCNIFQVWLQRPGGGGGRMIKVTTLDKREMYINAELIERVESVPETVITLTSGKKVLVSQPAAEIVDRIIAYRRRICLAVNNIEVK